MIQSIIDALRSVLGDVTNLFTVNSNYGSITYNYAYIIEYVVAGAVLIIGINWVFRFLHDIFL